MLKILLWVSIFTIFINFHLEIAQAAQVDSSLQNYLSTLFKQIFDESLIPLKNKLKEYNKMVLKLINEYREKINIVPAQKNLKPPAKTSIFKTGHHISLPINEQKVRNDNYDIAAFIASITDEAFAKDIVHLILFLRFEFFLDSIKGSES